MKAISRRMLRDWNRRARSDARYYVALGRRSQSWEDFFRGAEEVVNALTSELSGLDQADDTRRRALEIGCGPGRLMLPMSRHFDEIHGVDVSTEMIQLAQQNLDKVPHAYAHASTGTNLARFDDGYFDFVYSYAVFQHIPSREVVFNYIKETRRVLKIGGAARMQFNGMPKTTSKYDSWSGVRLDPEELASLSRENELRLLALEGVHTQDMWATFVKPCSDESRTDVASEAKRIVLREVKPADSSLTEVPARGHNASVSLRLEGLPARADLNTLRVVVGEATARLTRIEASAEDGSRRAVVALPKGLSPGNYSVHVVWEGQLTPIQVALRVAPPGPEQPRIISVTDGVFVGCGRTISSNIVRVSLEQSDRPEELRATVNGEHAGLVSTFCSAPDTPRFEVFFKLPSTRISGPQKLECWLQSRPVGSFEINVAADRFWQLRLCHPVEAYQAFRRFLWMRQEKRGTPDLEAR